MAPSQMLLACDTYGTAFRGGTATFLARVVNDVGRPLHPDDIATATYSVYELNGSDPDLRRPVPEHSERPLAIDQILSPSLRRDYPWDVDELGYNFRYTLDDSPATPFPAAGRHYLVEFRLRPKQGHIILVRFRVYTI